MWTDVCEEMVQLFLNHIKHLSQLGPAKYVIGRLINIV